MDGKGNVMTGNDNPSHENSEPKSKRVSCYFKENDVEVYDLLRQEADRTHHHYSRIIIEALREKLDNKSKTKRVRLHEMIESARQVLFSDSFADDDIPLDAKSKIDDLLGGLMLALREIREREMAGECEEGPSPFS